MASRQPLVAVVACALTVAACTGTRAAVDPMAPPDVFAPTPTIGELSPATTARPAPSTTTDVETAVIYRVDPVTLEALPGLDPIPMGDWTWGVSSPNGRWLALLFGDDSGVNDGVRLVDLPQWRVVGEWSQLYGSPMSVSDDGVVHSYIHAPHPQLTRVEVGLEEPQIVLDLPPQFSPWEVPRLLNGRIVLTGQSLESTSGQSTLAVVGIDQSTGTTTEAGLPEARMGATESVDLGDGLTGIIDSYPALAWDESNDRLLVVPATDDVVTELDLRTWETSHHRFGPGTDAGAQVTQEEMNGADFWTSTRRTAALAQGGGVMYVAGLIGGYVEGGESPMSIMRPSGIVAVDTSTWDVVDRLDAPISDVFTSPDGRRLLATGYREESTASRYSMMSSGLYVIDPTDLEVIVHHPPDRSEQYFGAVSYSQDRSLAYVTSYSTTEQVDVIDLESGEILANRTNIQVFGEVATVADASGGVAEGRG